MLQPHDTPFMRAVAYCLVQNNLPIFHHAPMMILAYIWAARLRSVIMAKGQIRGNKEVKKPKKSKEVVVPPSAIKPFNIAPKK